MKPISTALFAGTVASLLLIPVGPVEAATDQILYSFCSQNNCPDGGEPDAGVIEENNTLYGTTYYGGTGTDCGYDRNFCGTVFAFNLGTGAETVLHSFGGGTDGGGPYEGLLDLKGKLYGTTSVGGYYGAGTAFSLNLKNNSEKVLLSFGCCSDGFYPRAGLINIKSKLYGTTASGGAYGQGTVFSLNPQSGAITVLYSFCSQQSCADGANPGQLVEVNGVLYGTTTSGGAYNRGAVFSLAPRTGAETVLYSFCSQENCADGYFPVGGMIDVQGTLYGVTVEGGSYSYGTVFSLNTTTNTETVLHSFNFSKGDGWYPQAGVIDVNGTLYGTTYWGGNGQCYSGSQQVGCGTVFAIDLGTGAESITYSFQETYKDGQYPSAPLLNVNGTLYGTTSEGGDNNSGTLFSITP